MTQSAQAAVRAAAQRLAAVSDTPLLDAELLMAHLLGISRSDYLLKGRDLAEPTDYDALIERRMAHEPVAYMLGHQPFWTISLKVTPGVLIPRADSETLIEAAIGYFGDKSPRAILDLGSGPGTLLLAALDQWPHAQGVGIERSVVARQLAMENAEALGLAPRAKWLAGDWTQTGWSRALGNPFDLILCNPPYIEEAAELAPQVRDYEPQEALFAGQDGLDDYHHIIPTLPHLLAPGGAAILEIGWLQAELVSALAEAHGFTATVFQDLGGRDRAVLLEKRG